MVEPTSSQRADAPDLGWIGIAEAGRRFRQGTLTPVALTRHLLARIDRLDASCHAFLQVLAEIALTQAERAGAELAAGIDRGPLHGVPYALKDLVDVAGLPTTCHSVIRREHVATRDAVIVERLAAAGAILLGKTALHEFAIGGPATDLPWPPARNPWNLALHPGGSSSGSGSALAAGLVPAAIGTDTGGSIRNPATCCGLVGMKPTHGLVSLDGVFPLAPSLDHVGPMTRTVEDNALLLEVLAGRPGAYTGSLHQGVRGLAIGVVRHFHADDDPADPELAGAVDAAAERLARAGADVRPIRLPPLARWRDCGRVIQQAEQYAVHRPWLETRPQDYCGLSRAKLMPGAMLDERTVADARSERRLLTAALAAALTGVDAVLAVSGHDLPCRIDDPAAIARTYMRSARMPFSLAGVPAVALPTGFSASGLPLGVQLAAAAGQEAMLYRIGQACVDPSFFTTHRPDLARA